MRRGFDPRTKPTRCPCVRDAAFWKSWRGSAVAARVEALEADRLHLLVGVPTPEASAPMECSWAEMPRNVFGQAVVDEEPGRVTVGRFFEAGEYGADRRLVIRLFPLLEAAVPETILR